MKFSKFEELTLANLELINLNNNNIDKIRVSNFKNLKTYY